MTLVKRKLHLVINSKIGRNAQGLPRYQRLVFIQKDKAFCNLTSINNTQFHSYLQFELG